MIVAIKGREASLTFNVDYFAQRVTVWAPDGSTVRKVDGHVAGVVRETLAVGRATTWSLDRHPEVYEFLDLLVDRGVITMDERGWF